MKTCLFRTYSPSTPAAPARFVVRLIGLLSLLWLLLAEIAVGQDLPQLNPYKVEAAFLRNFAHYVTWPDRAFADADAPWHICVLGDDPFGEILEKTFAGRQEQGRSFEVFRGATLAALPTCQIVFVAYQDADRRRAALARLKILPILTVGNAPQFLRDGGIINFQVSEYIKISVNLDQARSVSLKIQAKMLEVSHEVLENGTIRRRR